MSYLHETELEIWVGIGPADIYESFCNFAKGQTISKANYGFLNSSKKRTKLTILSKEDAKDSEFCSFFGRNEDTINRFRDLLTFKSILFLWSFYSICLHERKQIQS